MEHLRQLLNLFFKVLSEISEKQIMNLRKLTYSLIILIAFLSVSGCDDNTLNDIGAKVSFSDDTYRTPESADSIVIPVGLNTPYYSDGSVLVSIEGGTYGEDYITDKDGSSFRLEFENGKVQNKFQIRPIDNNVLNTDRELEIRLSDPTGGIQIGDFPFLQVILLDDEVRMTAEVNFDSKAYEVAENDSLEVNLDFSSLSTDGGTIKVVSGGGDAVYGEDYKIEGANENGEITLNVDPYGDEASFKIIPVNNEVFEENKTFKLQILEVTGDLTTGESSIADVTIAEDDPSPFASVGFDQSSTASAEETAGEVTLNFALSQAVSGDQTIAVNLGAGSSATLGEDFTFANGSTDLPYIVNLADGATTGSITLNLLDDQLEEGNETVILNLTDASGDLQIDESSSDFTFTITDDEGSTGGNQSVYLETFESSTSESLLQDYNYMVEVIASTVVNPESANFTLNNAGGKFADVEDETMPSDWGIQMGYVNKADAETGTGSIDNVVISPVINATAGNYTFTYDVAYAKPNSTSVIEVYYSENSDGSSFSNGDWTLIDTIDEGNINVGRNDFARRSQNLTVNGNFHIAFRVKAEIGATGSDTEGTRWRIDNLQVSGN